MLQQKSLKSVVEVLEINLDREEYYEYTRGTVKLHWKVYSVISNARAQ